MMYKCTGYFLWTNSNPSKLKNDACVGKIVFTVIYNRSYHLLVYFQRTNTFHWKKIVNGKYGKYWPKVGILLSHKKEYLDITGKLENKLNTCLMLILYLILWNSIQLHVHYIKLKLSMMILHHTMRELQVWKKVHRKTT